MYLDGIKLTNFRNYVYQEIDFHPQINILHGLNAQGKTNLLEAIYYLSVSRSFRTNSDHELISWHGDHFFIKGTLLNEHSRRTIEIGYRRPGTLQIKSNGVLTKRGEYLDQNPVVIFSPDDILLIKGDPAGRRRFLNLEGSRLSSSYYASLIKYQRVLQQRNSILKDKFNKPNRQDLLQPWDDALVVLGSSIVKQREKMLNAIEQQARLFFSELTASAENLSLSYSSSIDYQSNLSMVEVAFRDQLRAKRNLENRRGCTLVGPHLDDFQISIDDYDVKKYGSQGQQRAAALAIRMSEVSLFQLSTGERPVILLDDVFSEFDQQRCSQLLDFLLKRDGQSFITTSAQAERIFQGMHEGTKIFSVDKGNITVE